MVTTSLKFFALAFHNSTSATPCTKLTGEKNFSGFSYFYRTFLQGLLFLLDSNLLSFE